MALTPEQQNIVAEYTRQQRAIVGAFARLLGQFEALDAMYVAQVEPLLKGLKSGEAIKDASGLAGVATLQRDEVELMAAAISDILLVYNTKALRELFVKMAGLANVLGR